jgi:hypothetical protein
MLCIHPAPREITRIWENKSSDQNINSGPFRAHLTSYALLILCTPPQMTSATVFEHLTFDYITFDHLGTFGGPVLLGGQLYALTCHHVVFDGTIYSENRLVPEKDFEKNLYVPSQLHTSPRGSCRDCLEETGDFRPRRRHQVSPGLCQHHPCGGCAVPHLCCPPSGTGYPHHELYGLTPLPIFGE